MRVTDEGVPVTTLIGVVKDSIKQAGVSRTSDVRDLRVASVQLILDVVASKTAGGRLDFCVPFIGMKLSLGAKVTKKDTHTIDMTLVPPEEQDARQVRGEVEDVLVNAIATIPASSCTPTRGANLSSRNTPAPSEQPAAGSASASRWAGPDPTTTPWRIQ